MIIKMNAENFINLLQIWTCYYAEKYKKLYRINNKLTHLCMNACQFEIEKGKLIK